MEIYFAIQKVNNYPALGMFACCYNFTTISQISEIEKQQKTLYFKEIIIRFVCFISSNPNFIFN